MAVFLQVFVASGLCFEVGIRKLVGIRGKFDIMKYLFNSTRRILALLLLIALGPRFRLLFFLGV